MLEVNINALKDESSWRRLTASLREIAISDKRLETIREQLIARIQVAPKDPTPEA